MRRVTKGFVLGVAGVVVLLLALGALPGLLKAGDPYYLTATAADPAGAEPLNASALSADRYPYTTAALASAERDGTGAGRSEPYWRGPVGVKGGFTHSPFDERAALERRFPAATGDGAVHARHNGTVYRLAVTREP